MCVCVYMCMGDCMYVYIVYIPCVWCWFLFTSTAKHSHAVTNTASIFFLHHHIPRYVSIFGVAKL